MTARSKYTSEFIDRVLEAWRRSITPEFPQGNKRAVAREMGLSEENVRRWVRLDKEGRRPAEKISKDALLDELVALLREHGDLEWRRYKQLAKEPGAHHSLWGSWAPFKAEAMARLSQAGTKPPVSDASYKSILNLLRKPISLNELAHSLGVSRGQALDMVDMLRDSGRMIHERNGLLSVVLAPIPAYVGGPVHDYVSRPDNTFLFGVTSDNHLGSKYERLDVLHDLYAWFEAEGADRALNAGNWIDGYRPRINGHDVHIHDLNGQMEYLAREFPRRDGIVTYAVSGDDHEGWWAQDGIDVGKLAEDKMREVGRSDWVDVGYMEAHIRLINANTGKFSILALVHPGGGSAYALSYSIQKIIESLEGGEKPAVGLYGHYHKLWAGNIRNVWCLQTGCTEDQTPFMRKKRLEAHVGGTLVKLRQDPETGAITGFMPEMRRYFNRGYYNQRWSHAGAVNLPERKTRA